jgi:hypothetical protein
MKKVPNLASIFPEEIWKYYGLLTDNSLYYDMPVISEL